MMCLIYYGVGSWVQDRFLFFFFNDTATTEIYTLSLHDALPISTNAQRPNYLPRLVAVEVCHAQGRRGYVVHILCRKSSRSEEHTSELQSRQYRMPSSA